MKKLGYYNSSYHIYNRRANKDNPIFVEQTKDIIVCNSIPIAGFYGGNDKVISINHFGCISFTPSIERSFSFFSTAASTSSFTLSFLFRMVHKSTLKSMSILKFTLCLSSFTPSPSQGRFP